jgi:hypothetical protein
VTTVLLAIRWSSHSYGEVRDFCEKHGKLFVRLPGGYNPNQVAHQILLQRGGSRSSTPMLILFLHGWQSTPGGIKATYLKDHGHEVLNPAQPDDDFDAAVRIAQAEFDRHQPDVVIGSSRGGAVAMKMDSGTTPLNGLNCPVAPRSQKPMMAPRPGDDGERPRR